MRRLAHWAVSLTTTGLLAFTLAVLLALPGARGAW